MCCYSCKRLTVVEPLRREKLLSSSVLVLSFIIKVEEMPGVYGWCLISSADICQIRAICDRASSWFIFPTVTMFISCDTAWWWDTYIHLCYVYQWIHPCVIIVFTSKQWPERLQVNLNTMLLAKKRLPRALMLSSHSAHSTWWDWWENVSFFFFFPLREVPNWVKPGSIGMAAVVEAGQIP